MNPSKPATVDEYLAQFLPNTRVQLEQMRSVIRHTAPKATEKISYGMPTYYQHENLVHFAGYAHHIGFYPGASGIAQFKDELTPYKHAKGSVQFPVDQRLPLSLVRRITEFRVREATARHKAKKKK